MYLYNVHNIIYGCGFRKDTTEWMLLSCLNSTQLYE